MILEDLLLLLFKSVVTFLLNGPTEFINGSFLNNVQATPYWTPQHQDATYSKFSGGAKAVMIITSASV